MRDGFIKAAAGTPQVRVADCRYNAEQIFGLMREADKQGVRVLCLPELCLTGYTSASRSRGGAVHDLAGHQEPGPAHSGGPACPI